jgi:hypothetical protein
MTLEVNGAPDMFPFSLLYKGDDRAGEGDHADGDAGLSVGFARGWRPDRRYQQAYGL